MTYIKYKKSRPISIFSFGIILLIVCYLENFSNQILQTYSSIKYIFPALFILIAIYEYSSNYLSFNDTTLNKHTFPKTSVNLNKVLKIEHKYNIITIITPQKKISINTRFIDTESLNSLNKKLNSIVTAQFQ